MPACRGSNLRSGDINEQFGLYLLQTVSLVAPVPRTEDVGVDVICTLVDDFEGNRLIAKESFCVQIKSVSVQEITYENAEVKWLFDLQLPLFIASVNKKTNSISLYTTHVISNVYIKNRRITKLRLMLNEGQLQPGSYPMNIEEIHLGPPILTWGINDSHDASFRKKFTNIMRSHIISEQISLQTRRAGWVEKLSWKTNEEASISGWQSMASERSEEIIEDIADKVMPYLSMILDYSMKFGKLNWVDELESLCHETKAIISKLKDVKQ